MRPLFKWLIRLVLLLILWVAGMGIYIAQYAGRDETRRADAAVVLGAAAWHTKPSPVLQERLNHALELYRKGVVGKLIFTGGFGEGAVMAESEVARDFAIAHGVPRRDILIEKASHSTRENVAEACRLLRAGRLESCLLVSDPLHMRRGVRMMRDAGVPCFSSPTGTSAYVSWAAKAGFLMREVVFFTAYLIAGK
ncbi:MAG: hypothetical protein JWL81_2148 [Verrucomicrobiales bacterium]|nr:hypothetical protein [Verrucomicrobiales bacterium]